MPGNTTAGDLAVLFAGMDPYTMVHFRIQPWATKGSGICTIRRDTFGPVTIDLYPLDSTIPTLIREGESA